MEVIVHGLTPEVQAELQKRMAKIYAQNLLLRVEKLNCPRWQKLKLLDAVAEGFRQQAEEERRQAAESKVKEP